MKREEVDKELEILNSKMDLDFDRIARIAELNNIIKTNNMEQEIDDVRKALEPFKEDFIILKRYFIEIANEDPLIHLLYRRRKLDIKQFNGKTLDYLNNTGYLEIDLGGYKHLIGHGYWIISCVMKCNTIRRIDYEPGRN